MKKQQIARLPQEYGTSGRFVHRLIKRGAKTAMYSKKAMSGVVVYEVFQIKVKKASEAFGKKYPPKEQLPGNEDFGKWAWSVRSRTAAERIYDKLENLKQS